MDLTDPPLWCNWRYERNHANSIIIGYGLIDLSIDSSLYTSIWLSENTEALISTSNFFRHLKSTPSHTVIHLYLLLFYNFYFYYLIIFMGHACLPACTIAQSS